MKLFDKLQRKKTINEKEEKKEIQETIPLSLVEIGNYALSSVRKEELVHSGLHFPLTELKKVSPVVVPMIDQISTVTHTSSESLYRVVNLGKDGALKAKKDQKTFWGAIKRKDGTSSMAELKKVHPNEALALDPTMLMMSSLLVVIEEDLNEIKELNQKILSFLEEEKESEIEADLEILFRSINDFKYNLTDEKYLINSHEQVMDIKRTANKNLLFYSKQIQDVLKKEKILTTGSQMNSILNDLEKKIKYYRLSLYVYSFSLLMEILLIGNSQTEYLMEKCDELKEKKDQYLKTYEAAFAYVKKNADRSLEGKVLAGIGSAEKTLGSLAQKVDVAKNKNVYVWLNQKGSNLTQKGQNFKNQFMDRLEEAGETNLDPFIHQIEQFDFIYNKTKEIYFDNENLYFTE